MAKFRKQLRASNNSRVDLPRYRDITPRRARFVFKHPDGSNVKIVLPFGPTITDFATYDGKYEQIDRPGKAPILMYAARNLRTMTFTALIVDRRSGGMLPGGYSTSFPNRAARRNELPLSVSDTLDQFELASQYGWPCVFRYGTVKLPYRSYLTRFSYKVTDRNADGELLRAECSFQLTEIVEPIQEIVRLPLVERPSNTSETGTGSINTGGPPPDTDEDEDEEEPTYDITPPRPSASDREDNGTSDFSGSVDSAFGN